MSERERVRERERGGGGGKILTSIRAIFTKLTIQRADDCVLLLKVSHQIVDDQTNLTVPHDGYRVLFVQRTLGLLPN